MNKTYRTVWNATTGTWVAAAETARGHSKSNSTMKSAVATAVAMMAGVGGVAVSFDADAQAANGAGGLALCGPTGGANGQAFGSGSSMGTALTAACGASSSRLSLNHPMAFQLYNNTASNGSGVGPASAATEVGIGGSKDGHLMLLGGSGVHIQGPADFDNNVNLTNHRINNLAAGTADTDAVNVAQLKAAITASDDPYVSIATGLYATAKPAVTTAGNSGIAIGANASSTGVSAIALGGNTVASAANAMAIGTIANATAAETTAVGVGANATANNATALGRGASATAANSAALGSYSVANRANSVSVGNATTQRQIVNVAAGTQITDAVNLGQMNTELDKKVDKTTTKVGGTVASTASGNASNIAIGSGAASTSGTANSASIALGANASATGAGAIAVGSGSTTSGSGGAAFGVRSNAGGANAVALGTDANATGTNSVALGYGSTADRANAVSVGSSTLRRQITNMAAGTQATDAVNLSQLTPVVTALGGGATINATTGAVTGPTYNLTNGGRQTTVGDALSALDGSITTVNNNLATKVDNRFVKVLGSTDATAAGLNSVAIGNGAITGSGDPSVTNQVAIGSSANAQGLSAVAIGSSAATDGTGAQAVGRFATATGNFATAMGNQSSAQAAGATALGDRASVATGATNSVAIGSQANIGTNVTNSVALGAGSTATRNNTVSVGSSTVKRQITDVAAGTLATDAVNLAQLNAAIASVGPVTSSPYFKANGAGDGSDDAKAVGVGSVAVGSNASTTTDGGVAIGDNAASTMANGVAIGKTAVASLDGVAIGRGADATTTNAIALGAQSSAADNATSLGFNAKSASNAMALGANTVAVGNNSVALGNGSVASAANTVSVGSAGNERKIVNVAAGDLSATSTDAVNGSQLFATNQDIGDLRDSLKDGGVIDPNTGKSLAVVYDDASKKAVTLGGAGAPAVQLKNVADATENNDAVNLGQLKDAGLVAPVDPSNPGAGLESLAVTYGTNADGSANFDSVALKGGTNGTTLSNVAAGKADKDAVNVSQLKDSGLIGGDGKAIAAVTYDRNADGTPNLGSVTLGGAGASTPVALKNVADATENNDAVNLGQLKDAGLVAPVDPSNPGAGLASLAVTYGTKADGSANFDSVALKGGANGTTLSNVAAGVADKDAVNVSQLKGSGLIGDDGKALAAVTYDVNADGTPNYNSVQLGSGKSTGPVALSNVADGKADDDAVNVGQLKTSGLIGEDDKGNLTSLAVAYDDASKGKVTLGGGAAGTTITNVKAGDLSATSTDAVNGSQLFATNQDIGDLRDSLKDGGVIDPTTGESLAVVYDGTAKDKVTLGDGNGPVKVTNVADATGDSDALNLGQLKQSGLVGDDGKGNLTSLAVAYDDASKGKVTLGGGATGTTITNVKAGDLSATSTDAVNGSQLFATNQDIGDLRDSLKDGGVIDPTTGESLAVVYDGTAKDKVTLAGTTGTTITNVKAGVADLDAVNVSQLKDSGLIGGDGKAIAAVTYDRNADGTPNFGSVTLGGAGASTPVALKNVAAGVDGTDAVNVDQMTDGLTKLKDEIGSGAADLRFVKVNADQTTGTPALATGAQAVAIGAAANSSGAHALALGTGSRATGLDSVAIGYNSVANEGNTVSVGSVSNQRRIVNVANGNVAADSTDAVNGGQLYAAMNNLSTSMDAKTQQALNDFTTTLDEKTQAAVDNVKSRSIGVMDVSAPLVAVEGLQGNNLASLNGADPNTATAIAVGSSSAASGANAVAVGLQNVAGSDNSVAIGSFAGTGAGQAYSVAVGSDAQTNGTQAVALGAHVQAGGDRAVAVGNNNTWALGDSSVAFGDGAKARAGTTNSIAVGTNANVAANVTNAMALGANANVATGATGGIALGAGSLANRGNALSIGSAGAERQIINVAAGTQATDAVNVSQLTGVTTALGGKAAVGADGSITQPTYTVGGTDYHNVGDALDALAQTGDANAVVYDGTAKDKVTLAGTTGTTLSNVKAGVADMDAVNVSQLKDSGLIGGDGKAIAAVTYDRNADGTPNYGSVTLGDGNGPVKVTNVADATGDSDALNLGQLKQSGLVGDDGKGNLTSLAVAYDDASKGKVTLGGGATGTTITNVKAGDLSATSTDAVNGSQLFATNQDIGDLRDSLKDGGVIDPTTGESLAVVYDGTAKDKVTLAGTTGTTLSNVKAGVADMDAVNVSQLKDSGLIGGDGKAIAAVTYDRNADGTPNYGSVTLGDGNGPVKVSNVADATGDSDALNLGQLKQAGLVGDDGKGNLTSLAVAYDDASKGKVTLGGGATGTTITNVKAGDLSATSTDAVNGSQLFATNQDIGDLRDSLKDGGVIDPTTGESLAVVYDGTAKDKVTLAGATGTTLSNVKAGVADMDAVNVSQLKGSGLVGDDGKAIAAVTYDRNTDGTPNYGSVTLGSAGASTPVALKNVAAAVDGTDAVNYGQLQKYVADNAGGPGNPLAVAYDDAAKGAITLGGANGTTITNVAAGAVSATSTDAINGSQLHGVSQSVADSLGGGSTVGTDGSVTAPTYSLADPADASKKTDYHSVGDALDNLDGRVVDNTKNITVINNQLADSGLVDPSTGQAIAAVTYDRNTDGTPNYNSVKLGGDKATGPVALSNVADGVARHDAVNLGQLQDAGLVAPVDPSNPGAGLASLAVTYGTNADGSANFDEVALKGGTNGTTIKNVAAGDVSATSKDAINGSQLFATNERVGSLEDSLQSGGVIDPVTRESLAVVYDSAAKDHVTLGGKGATAPVTLSNVAAGTADTDAVNVAQLKDAGLVAPVDPTNPGSGLASLAVTYGKNADGSANFDSVSLKGTAGTTITNVAAGAVSATSTDAINGAQLHGVSQSVADSLGGGSTVGADGTVTNPTYSLADPADASKKQDYHNVGDALDNLDGRVVDNTKNITVINNQLADSGLVDPLTGQSIAAVTYDRNADGTSNYNSVKLGGDKATGPVALKNVADGVDRTDAVNVGQLQDAGLVAPVDPTKPGTLASLAVTYGKNTDGTANFDQVVLAGKSGTTITNVKAGAVNATSTDAVNGAQLHGVSQSVADSLGGGSTVDANGNVTNPTYTVNNQTFNNVGDAITNISNSLADGSIGLVQQDETTRDITVAKDTDGTVVDFTGTAGDRKLTGVAAGTVSATSNDAINGSQLHGTAQSVADVIGGGTTVDVDGKLADTAIQVNGQKYSTVAEAVQAAAAYGATDSLAVRYDLNADGTPNYGSVTLGGTGAAPVILTNVADGVNRNDAVNFGQLSDLSDKFDGLGDRVGALEQNPGNGGGSGGGSGDNPYFSGTDVTPGSSTAANAGTGTGNTAAGSGASVGGGANNATVIGSNASATKDNGAAIGSGAKSTGEGATAIGSNASASGSQSVAIGSGSVANEANTVSFGNADNPDTNRRIVNIADGVNANDAASKGQLDRAVGGLQGQINDVSKNAYSGIAAATALTMIPGVDPGKTLSFGVGGATYKGYQAVAFGGEARITQNLKMKAGVGLSSGGNTVGVGASYQW